MGFSTQGGHSGQSSADAGDRINASPVSFGGAGVRIGNIMTGDKQQSPGTTIGGSNSTSGFSADLSGLSDFFGKKNGAEGQKVMLLNLYAQPQYQ